MNYYRFYPGDYAGDTQHLSLVQHGAYLLLLNYCYAKDVSQLPKNVEEIYRICRAVTRHEQAAVRGVVEEFFPGLRNTRIQKQLPEEMSRIQTARDNGLRGGRPSSKPSGLPSGLANIETQRVTQRVSQRGRFCESSPTPTPTPTPSPTPPPLYGIQKADTVVIGAETAPDDGTGSVENGNGAGGAQPCPHQAIVDLYHEILPMCPKVRIWTAKRKLSLATRWREDPGRQSLAWWRGYFEDVAESSFLTGRTKEEFVCCLEWLVKPTNLVKVYEGNYHR